jgi:hypothetical protein
MCRKVPLQLIDYMANAYHSCSLVVMKACHTSFSLYLSNSSLLVLRYGQSQLDPGKRTDLR